ncbi:hypothetical protein ABZ912_33960 [Nonomuraea angiospora]
MGKHKGEEPSLKPFAPPKERKSQSDGDGGEGKRGSGDGGKKDGK